MRKSHIIIDYFTTNFTIESSYILGLLWADGHVNPKTNEIRISALSKDIITYLPIFQKTGIWLDFWNNKKQKTRNNKPQGTLTCSNKNLKKFLTECNYTPHNTNSTNIVSVIPKCLQHYWYRGFVDGDGCWTYSKTSRTLPSGKLNTFYNRKFTITGPKEQDWNFFETLLKKLNINYKINRYRKSNKYSHLTVTGKENFLKLGNYLYKTFEKDKIGLPRKYCKWKEIINSYKS